MTGNAANRNRTNPALAGFDRPVLMIAIVSLIAMAFAAGRGDKLLAMTAAALFAGRVIATAIRMVPATGPLAVVRFSTQLTAVTMLWSALALLIAYPIIGLKWQHGWQYGLGFALLAAMFIAYAVRLNTTSGPAAQPGAIEIARRLSAVLALAVLSGAGWLITAGKLDTIKNDWLANDVFLAAAACVFVLSVIPVLRARPA